MTPAQRAVGQTSCTSAATKATNKPRASMLAATPQVECSVAEHAKRPQPLWTWGSVERAVRCSHGAGPRALAGVRLSRCGSRKRPRTPASADVPVVWLQRTERWQCQWGCTCQRGCDWVPNRRAGQRCHCLFIFLGHQRHLTSPMVRAAARRGACATAKWRSTCHKRVTVIFYLFCHVGIVGAQST